MTNTTSCCLLDLTCNPTNPNLQSCKAFNSATLDPTSTTCQSSIHDYCLGDDLDLTTVGGLQEWNSRWVPGGACPYMLARNATQSCSLVGPLQASGLTYDRNLINDVFNKYTSLGYVIGSLPGNPGYNEFQTNLFSVCFAAPGICQSQLNSICAAESAANLQINPGIAPWCGCYLPAAEYASYTDTYQVTRQCTPYCNREGTIPLVAPDLVTVEPCTQSLCIIDNVSLTLLNSSIGDLTFSQLCGSCGNTASNTCQCVISDLNIIAVDSQIGSINLSQNCGKTNCVRTNPDPNGTPQTLTVPCDAPADFNPFATSSSSTETIIITIGIVLAFVIILLIIFALSGKK